MKLRFALSLAASACLVPGLDACDREPAPAATSAPADGAGEQAGAPPEMPVMGPEVPIVAFGDSLFAGYGLERGQSYPAQLERALRARGINARIANAGVSGDTTAAGLQRLAFTLDNQPRPPKLALVELGANDMLRALPADQARANLDAILTEFGRRRIPVVLMGMLAAPNLGEDYARSFNAIYPDLARKHGATLVPFFLQAVVGNPAVAQQDHIHPTERGVELIVADTVGTVGGAIRKLPRGSGR